MDAGDDPRYSEPTHAVGNRIGAQPDLLADENVACAAVLDQDSEDLTVNRVHL
jgi:hypothetical protein